MKAPQFIFILGMFLFYVACAKNDEPFPESTLGADAEKWEALSLKDYDYTLQISCFCMVEYTMPKRIEVRDNKVISVAGVPIEKVNDPSYRTINGFFEYIIEQRKLDPVVEKIEYDSEFGFPTYIFFDISEMIADEEIAYTLTNFTPY